MPTGFDGLTPLELGHGFGTDLDAMRAGIARRELQHNIENSEVDVMTPEQFSELADTLRDLERRVNLGELGSILNMSGSAFPGEAVLQYLAMLRDPSIRSGAIGALEHFAAQTDPASKKAAAMILDEYISDHPAEGFTLQ